MSSLLAVDNVRRVLSFREVHFGVTFRFPSTLPDLWTFVSVPNQGSGIHVSPTLFFLPVLIPLQAALVAGLVGSVHEAIRTGEYDFAGNARRYFVPVLVFVALVRIAGFAAFSVGVLTPLLLVVLLPAFVVLSYFFYATPYLLVVADSGVEEALSRSYEWALDGGPYFAYGAGYFVFVAVVSLVGTALVVNLGALGLLVGALASAPVALALTFATTEFVAAMAGRDASGGNGEVGGGGDDGVSGDGGVVGGVSGDGGVVGGVSGDGGGDDGVSGGDSGVGNSAVGGSGGGGTGDGDSGVSSSGGVQNGEANRTETCELRNDDEGNAGEASDGNAGTDTDASTEETDNTHTEENSDTHELDAQTDADRETDAGRQEESALVNH